MLSTSEIILELICPLCGIITASFMFSAPYRDTKKASEIGTLGNLNPTPWIFMLGNTYGWVLYGSMLQNLFIFFANAPGFILSIWLNLQAIKLQYENFRSNEMRKSIVSALVLRQSQNVQNNQSQELLQLQQQEQHKDDINDDEEKQQLQQQQQLQYQQQLNGKSSMMMIDYAKIVWDVTSQSISAPVAYHEIMVILICMIWLGITAFIVFANNVSNDTKEMIVGIVVNINLMFFYGAPLSTILCVINTKNSISIHIPTMITNTCNGIFWAAYGFAVDDYFVSIPNGLGALLGCVQFLLCLLFPRRTNNTNANNTIISNEQQQQQQQPLNNNDNNGTINQITVNKLDNSNSDGTPSITE